ncbi:hypothetical protein [Fusobacterium varium]|uniref:hypothetical protein n=1 Tax=Fusobacterium varium TaxID=856 RepID=UPI000BBAFF74|nr:hypothetical protein [uncultured Fusobacterium sp.]BBA52126.1 hypothetical protein FV113G1_24760 [Fusobacterium varium]
MTDIEIKLIKFLLTSSVYSDNAVMKNLGINEEELAAAYNSLEKNGYLESYKEYESRNPKTGCSSNCCSNGNCSNCNKCSINTTLDTSKVKVITVKAILEFDNN